MVDSLRLKPKGPHRREVQFRIVERSGPPRVVKLTTKNEHDGRPACLIGRADDADVMVPNPMVSRRHAVILPEEDGTWVLIDLGSGNGTFVNGCTVLMHVLKPGDSVQIGKMVMVFEETAAPALTPAKTLPPRSLPPPAGPPRGTPIEGTFLMEGDDAQRYIALVEIGQRARVESVDRKDVSWKPDIKGLVFGGAGIPVVAWFARAEIAWNGSVHVLRRTSGWGTVKVNGRSVKERALAKGDEFQIGRSKFRYLIGTSASNF